LQGASDVTPSSLPALLLELARQDRSDVELAAEGFNVWEIAAARAIVKRDRAKQHPAGTVTRHSDPPLASSGAL
jgi:hypothetical protein